MLSRVAKIFAYFKMYFKILVSHRTLYNKNIIVNVNVTITICFVFCFQWNYFLLCVYPHVVFLFVLIMTYTSM